MKTWFRSIPRLFVIPVVLLLILALAFPVFAQAEPVPILDAPVVMTLPAQAIPEFQLTPEILGTIAGAVLSLLFSYIPGLNAWFAAFDETRKRGIMALLLLIVALAVFGLGCAGIVVIGLACSSQGAIQLAWIYILAIIGNQSVFSLSPRTKAVQDAKALAARLHPYSE